ncbi:MAG: hypothetical protein OQL19_01765 [Gammaproteobacteria bacterium]|nr:hypothetical protein [Gammaproteobacteria bacterium]
MSIKVCLIFVGLFFSTLAFAGSGKAISPHWSGDDSTTSPTYIFISNITDKNVNVSVTFYGDDGTVIPVTTYTNFINGNTQLAPRATGRVKISPPVRTNGYAVIEWENEASDDNIVALVAHGYRVMVNSTYRRADITIPVNNGMPF